MNPDPSPEPVASDRAVTGLGLAGQALGRAAVSVGKGASAAWRSIDPDLLRHLAQLPLMGLTMLQPGRAPLQPLPDDGHRPVLFVHGLGGHRGNFTPMRLWFRMHERSRSYALALRPDAGLDELAADLRLAVAEVLQVNGLPPGAQVDVVAHSMGGLVARLALLDATTAGRIGHLVTLGTPHAGTHAARLARSRHALDLRPESPVILRLREQLPWPGPPTMPRLTALWSRADVLLLPATSGAVPGAENVELTDLTHYGYLLLPACWRRVVALLAG